MSYDIIKSVKIKDDKVIVKHAPNNVYPRRYYNTECESLTKILNEQGRDALDIEILKEYENGNFHKGNKNRYTRALEVLTHFPEYPSFNWRNNGEAYKEAKIKRGTKEFDALLLRAIKTRLPKDKFIVLKSLEFSDRVAYLRRVTKTKSIWSWEKSKAKTFRYKEDVDSLKSCFENSGYWYIEKIA